MAKKQSAGLHTSAKSLTVKFVGLRPVHPKKAKAVFGRAVTNDPHDAPELLDGFFEQAEIRAGDRVVRPGRPRLAGAGKVRVGVRIDPDVLAAYKNDGPGWQTRINADLRKARRLKKA